MKDSFIQKVMPDPILRDYINQYTFVDIPYDQAKQLEFTVMPSSHTRMVFFLGEPSLIETEKSLQLVDKLSLTGFITKPHLFIPTCNLQQVMIHFTAWGIQPFVDFPISEITDTRADLNFIFKQDLENLCAGLHGGVALQEKAFTLNSFFKNKLRKVRQIDNRAKALTQYILQNNGTMRLQHLAKNLFLGERTAQRLIHNATGVNYKFFTKIVRLEFVRRLLTQEHAKLTDLAIRAGYFDQAHFIHDFQATFNESPGEYLKKHQKLVWNKVDTH